MRYRALLLILILCVFPWCGTSKPKGGLIVARSVSREGPLPATMLILRPGADGWSREEVTVPPGKITLQPGVGADGKPYVRRLGQGGGPPSNPLQFVRSGDAWTVAEAPGVAEKDITWVEDKGKPEAKVFELKGGNVFHKCMWFKPAYGEPGILTISANMPYLQIWREPKGPETGFQAETLWTAIVGQREQRFRDIEAGDVNGDGKDELVLVTHDMGAVYVIEQTPQGMKPQEIYRDTERTFTHEVEIADVDGDKKLEFFTTPSMPNRLNGKPQGGRIDMYRWDAASRKHVRSEVARFPDRHAKEILAADLDKDGRAELYAALEAEGLKGAHLLIRGWAWKDGAMSQICDIPLPGEMCRFLNTGDTDGDGVPEIIASTKEDGIYRIQKKAGNWEIVKIVPGSVSSGFEHATVVFDWDSDGRDDIFAAGDEQKKLHRFWLPKGESTYQSEDIADFSGEKYFIWNLMPLPPGK